MRVRIGAGRFLGRFVVEVVGVLWSGSLRGFLGFYFVYICGFGYNSIVCCGFGFCSCFVGAVEEVRILWCL